MSRHSLNLIISLFAYMLAGYLLGLVIGFTVFDPDLDVWALLGAVFAIIGLLVGALPAAQRYVMHVLFAICGLFLGEIGGILLFGDIEQDGLLEALEDWRIILIMLIGTGLGIWRGTKDDAEHYRIPLFAFVLGGFLTPLVLILLLGIRDAEADLAPLIIITGSLWAGLALWWQRRVVPQH